MNSEFDIVPVILFTYARPTHLQQTLASLRANQVPLIYTFSDGPATPDKMPAVAEVRCILHDIDWCQVIITERETNLGLGKSILTGVTEVLKRHQAALIFEDDLICVPDAYQYLAAALEQYRDDSRVMSVAGWTHPKVTPSNVSDRPYFDGRAECWVWGTWARAWIHMEQSAQSLLEACAAKGIDVNRYGNDLPRMAMAEQERNIWAVRLLYSHILENGLCLRPPWSMVEHIGYDVQATNTTNAGIWAAEPLKACPPLPENWPVPLENPECPKLWQNIYGYNPVPRSQYQRIGRLKARAKLNLKRVLKPVIPPILVKTGREVLYGGIRHTLKMITPPVLVPIALRLSPSKSTAALQDVPQQAGQKPDWEYVPEGWSRQNKDQDIKGWNVQSVVDSSKERLSSFREKLQDTWPIGISLESSDKERTNIYFHNLIMSYAYALLTASHQRMSITMLDWGGGIGQYYVISKALAPDLEIDYSCKELPLFVECGQQLFPDAHFYTDESCLRQRYDFVVASGSLHYLENWPEMLAKLARAVTDKGYLFVTRVPTVFNVPSYVMIQRPYVYGYNTEYLGWCINRKELLVAAQDTNLLLRREFVVETPPHILCAPEQCQYWGYLFQKGTPHD